MPNIIGVDLGGTNIKTALVSLDGKILDKCEISTETRKGTATVIKNIAYTIKKVKKGNIGGIGIGSPGPMSHKSGVITNPVNLPFKNTPLRKIIQNKFKWKVYLDNDANCFALAEAVFGQGRKYENVVGITLGTGFGGGLVMNKKIFRGRNNATEFGHMTIKFDGKKARSGNQGSVEEYVAARGVMGLFGNGRNPYEIQRLAFDHNKKAIQAYGKMGYYLGVGLANIMYAFDPDVIIIGGKLSNAWKLFSKPMIREVRKRYFVKPCEIKKSKLKEPGILGAAALVLE